MYGSSPYGVEVYGGLPQVSASSAPASSEELVYHYARSQSKVLDFVDPACPIEWSHPLNQGLVAWWKVLSNSGWRGGLTFRDLVRGGKKPSDGTLVNGTSFSSVRHVGGCGSLLFDGTDDYATMGAVGTGSPPWTIVAMVNLTSTSNFYPEFLTAPSGAFGGDNLLRFFGSTSQVNFNDGGVSINTPDALPLNAFSMIAVTQTASNTVVVSARWRGGYTSATDTGFGTAWSSIVLGRRWNLAGNAFPGYLDEVRLHKGVAFTKAQLEALYQEQLRGSPETLRWVGAKTYFLPVAVPATTTTAYGGSKSTELVDPSCPIDWSHPLNRGLVGCWSTLPNSGWRGGLTLRDLLRGGKKSNDGTLTNGPTWIAGPRGSSGGALRFVNASDTSVNIGRVTSVTDNFAVGAWVYNNSNSNVKQRICCQGNEAAGWSLGISDDGSGLGGLYMGIAWLRGAFTQPAARTWYHFLMTRVSGTTYMYLNGVQSASTYANTPSTPTSGKGSIGTQYDTAYGPDIGMMAWDGGIGDVRIYARGLSVAEVQALYQEQLRGSPETLNWVKTKSYYLPVQPTPTSISYGGSKYTEIVDPACPVDWSHPLNRGLVGCWKVISNSGWRGGLTFRDLVRGGKKANNGTLTNGPTWNGGHFPGGYGSISFEGDPDYISVTSPSALLTYPGTQMMWVYLRSRGSGDSKPTLFYSNNEYLAINGTSGFLQRFSGGWQTASSGEVTVNTWHHVAYANNGSTWRYYLDGREVYSGSQSASSPDTSTAIGTRLDAFFSVDGLIDDARIYNRSLTAAEVKALYQEQLCGSPETLNWVRAKSYSIFTPSSGGGTSFTISDSPFTTDSVARALTLFRTAGDSPATTDSVTRTGAFTRTTSDSPLTTDTVTRAFTGFRTASDSPLTTDTVTRAFTGFRTADDTPSTSDSVVAEKNSASYSRTLSDSPSTTDSVARAGVFTRTLSDGPSTADEITRALTCFRTVSDTPSTSDSVAGVRSYSRTLSDAPSTTDSVASVLALLRTLSDAPSTTDSISRGFTGYRTLADAPFTTDIVYYTIPTADSAVIEDLINFGFTTQEVVNYGFTTTEVISYG